MSISLPPKGSDAKKLGAEFAPLKVEVQSTPNMTVKVAEGAFWTADNEHMEYVGGTTPTISPPASDAKWVLITITSTGMLNIVDGIASGTPQLPASNAYKDELPLAALFVGDTTTAITNDMVFDLRPLWKIPPDSVSQSQLADFATITYVDNGLNTKAGISGTANPNFTLNIGGSNINDSGLYVDRFSGADVGIRFNETAAIGSPPIPTPGWEFTNDGVTWNPIGVSQGSYYTKTDLNSGGLDFRYYTQNDLTNATQGSGVLDSRYYEMITADVTFAPIVHMHNASDINGLSDPVETINGISPVLGDVQLGLNDLNGVTNALPGESHVIVYRTGSYINSLLNTNDLLDVDTTSTTPVLGDVLVHNGGTGFVNRPLVKTDISDFSGAAFVLVTNVAGDAPAGDGPPDSNGTAQDIYGVKTFKDGINIESSLTVTGTNTSIQTAELKVSDPYVDINWGETGTGVGGGTGVSGIRVDRGPAAGSPTSNPPAVLQWDEGTKQWEVGVEGNAEKIITGAHTHNSSQITDFAARVVIELATNPLDALGDVTYLTSPATGEYLRFGATAWENKNFAIDVISELNVNALEQMSDVSYMGSPTVVSGEFLQWTGTEWINHTAVKADISDFIETDYIHVTGDEAKIGNFTINGDFTIDGEIGSITSINSETVNIRDSVITLNAGESGNGVAGGTGTAGIEIDRGIAGTNAVLWWSEIAKTWFATHTISSGSPASPTLTVNAISFVGHEHTISDISGIQQQLDLKINRSGDAMDDAVNLIFALGGEILGLPLTPSGPDAATSAAYVDAHVADDILHITTEQNTFLDGLSLTGSPALAPGDVNQLIDISGNVQSLLDIKIDKSIPVTDQNLAALDITTGNIVDSGVVINDSGVLISEIWTANKIDTTKADKIVPALPNNLAGLNVNGNLIDSGVVINDTGTLISEIWTANKIDTVKMDKQPTAVVGNFGEFDISGNLIDGGNNLSTLAPAIHSHVVVDITDFAAGVTSELGNNSIATLSDVSNNPPAAGDFLRWSSNIWDNTPAANITEFVRATGEVNETITGDKIFTNFARFLDNVNITGELTVNGNAIISGDLTVLGDQIIIGDEIVTANRIIVNSGGSVASSHAGGLVVERDSGSPITDNPTVLLWDETGTQRWKAGIYDVDTGLSSIETIALENVTLNQPFYNLQSGLGGGSPSTLAYLPGFVGNVSQPAPGKTAVQVFVNGIKQIEIKAYTVDYSDPSAIIVTFISGSEPALNADVEFYGFGFIG